MANYHNHDRKHGCLSRYERLDVRQYREELSALSNYKPTRLGGCELTTTPCNYGGVRYWLVCHVCGGRKSCLYLYQAGMFACAGCLNAVHKSAQQSKTDRLHRQQWLTLRRYRLKERFQFETWTSLSLIGAHHIPPRMHQTTWAKICERHNRRAVVGLRRSAAWLERRTTGCRLEY